MSNSLRHHGPWLTRLLCPWNFPDKNIGADCHFLLQGIFLKQGLNLRLLHWQADSLPLSHKGSLLKSLQLREYYSQPRYKVQYDTHFPVQSGVNHFTFFLLFVLMLSSLTYSSYDGGRYSTSCSVCSNTSVPLREYSSEETSNDQDIPF